MQKAIETAREKIMDWLSASKIFNVPQKTCEGIITTRSWREEEFMKIWNVLKWSNGKALLKHILDLEQKMFSLTQKELRTVAYELAERDGTSHQFSKDKKWLAENVFLILC